MRQRARRREEEEREGRDLLLEDAAVLGEEILALHAVLRTTSISVSFAQDRSVWFVLCSFASVSIKQNTSAKRRSDLARESAEHDHEVGVGERNLPAWYAEVTSRSG
eukprot:3487788-Rhodomonas_salina.1